MTPEIVEIERVPVGALVTFENGRSAVYSTLLLYELLPNARLVAVDDEPESEA
jgi:hypothetical protein